MARAVTEPRPPIDAVAKQPLTFDRIRRGIARRIRNRTADLRDLLFLRLASVGGWLASLYYATVSPEFWREHVAVIRGRQRYRRSSMLASSQFFRLRRNVHRLEKGLIMRPRRPTFALDYIGETVDCYARLVELSRTAPEAIDADELRWARDVLAAYFEAVAPTRAITQVRARFDAAGEPPMPVAGPSVPYARDLSALPSVDYDALLALSQRRRSVRWYRQEPVPREMIDRAIEVAAQAPSACNRQPFEFRIVDEPEMVRRIVAIPPGTAGFADNLPAVAVIVGKLDAFAKERDRHLIYIDGALAAMAFIYALETQGLSSCCINWADAGREERAMREALQLRPEERVVMLVAFGYPDPEGMVPYSAKVPLDILRRFN
jgi:nitroreductase